jgi:hypothetical protein
MVLKYYEAPFWTSTTRDLDTCFNYIMFKFNVACGPQIEIQSYCIECNMTIEG